jgi:hypothetical protein
MNSPLMGLYYHDQLLAVNLSKYCGIGTSYATQSYYHFLIRERTSLSPHQIMTNIINHSSRVNTLAKLALDFAPQSPKMHLRRPSDLMKPITGLKIQGSGGSPSGPPPQLNPIPST